LIEISNIILVAKHNADDDTLATRQTETESVCGLRFCNRPKIYASLFLDRRMLSL